MEWKSMALRRVRRVAAGSVRRALRLPCGTLFEAYYLIAQYRLSRPLSPTSTTAVSIHLYYVDTWDLFARKLGNLQGIQFDLFITVPARNRQFAERIRAEFPDAHITVVPNHGRGTLPFIKIAQVLLKHQYEVVLKLHCKKSTPFEGGQPFLEVVVDRLLPDSPRLIHEGIERLSSSKTAILGPSEVYTPLYVSLAPNRDRIALLISNLLGQAVAQQVLDNPARYGFFAGTMFWARLDAIEPLLRFRAFDFEPEFGQRDGTLAHALERVFSLLPQLQGRQVLELVDGAIQPRMSECHNVPRWFNTARQ